jgi:DNA polymerase-4
MTEPRACLYVDADRFYFSVEALERPELADDPRPIVISQDPRVAPRAVVTTANDAARKLGIGSALSAAIALRRAPDALFLPPRHELYSRHSGRLMELLRTESPLVQQNSIDEAALQWDHHGFDREPAVRLRERVLAELGLSVSFGLAGCPLVAKMASETAKSAPDHVHVVPPGEEPAFLAPMAIRALIGVGPKAEERLRALGIETIGQIAERSLPELVGAFGASYGRYLYRASRGDDDSELSDQRQSKSISAESTFAVDTRDRAELWKELRAQSEEVSRRLQREGLLAAEVAIKLRYASWETITRQMRLSTPTDDGAALAAGAAALMRRHWDRARPVRLLGVRAGRLQPTGDLVQPALL